MSTRERKLRYIAGFDWHALEAGAAEMLADKGEGWLTDEQIADITDYYVKLARRRSRDHRRNRAIAAKNRAAGLAWGNPPGTRWSDVLPAPGRTYRETMRCARIDALQGKPDGEAA